MNFILLTTLLFSSVTAHLAAGEDITKNDYIIDFGFSPEELTTNKISFINVNLVNQTTKEDIIYSSAWVKISDNTSSVFTGVFHAKSGNINFQYLFPKKGNYTINIEFRNNKEEPIIDHSFNVNVKENSPPQQEKQQDFNKYLIFLIGILIGIFGGIVVKKLFK